VNQSGFHFSTLLGCLFIWFPFYADPSLAFAKDQLIEYRVYIMCNIIYDKIRVKVEAVNKVFLSDSYAKKIYKISEYFYKLFF